LPNHFEKSWVYGIQKLETSSEIGENSWKQIGLVQFSFSTSQSCEKQDHASLISKIKYMRSHTQTFYKLRRIVNLTVSEKSVDMSKQKNDPKQNITSPKGYDVIFWIRFPRCEFATIPSVAGGEACLPVLAGIAPLFARVGTELFNRAWNWWAPGNAPENCKALYEFQDSAIASMTLLMVLKESSVFGAISSEASIYFIARFVEEATASWTVSLTR